LILFIKFIFIFLKVFIFVSCAAVMSPPGGEKDIIPPVLIKTVPTNRSTNYKEGVVELVFSEYIDESSVRKAIKILPVLDNEPDIIYKGKRIVISFNNVLVENQTYIISINRNLSDEHKIKLDQGIQFAFSTGEKIDDSSISGKLYYSKTGSVQLWKIKNKLDSIEFYNRVPDYSIDASDDGYYEFNYLSPGSYRIAAVDYSLSGLPILPNKMLYGLHHKPIIKLKDQENVQNINIYIPDQKNKLEMVNAEWIEGSWGSITLSKSNIDLDRKVPIDIFYEDSRRAKINFFWDPLTNTKLNFKLDSLTQDYITIKTNEVDNEDYFRFDSGAIKIRMDTLSDTTNIALVSPKPNSEFKIEEDNIIPLRLVFSSLIDSSENTGDFFITQDSTIIPYSKVWESPISVKLFPEINWSPKRSYNIDFNIGSIYPLYRNILQDSLYSFSINTTDYQKYGSMLIRLDTGIFKNLKVKLKPFNKDILTMESNFKLDNTFKLTHIPEGNYSLLFYQDLNGDSQISTGIVSPYQSAEWFSFYPDTIKIRANWEIELDNIDLGRIN